MIGKAGSIESSDCLITVEENEKLEIIIDSVVGVFFFDQIKHVIEETLKEMNLEKVKVTVQDKGALDYTIKSRLISAIKRME